MANNKKTEIIIPGKDWIKLCGEMFDTLPKEQAVKAIDIVIKYTKNQ